MSDLPESTGNLPNIYGSEARISEAVRTGRERAVFRRENEVALDRIKKRFAVALHMHQPLIPAGGQELMSAEIISNVKYIMDNQPGSGFFSPRNRLAESAGHRPKGAFEDHLHDRWCQGRFRLMLSVV